MTLSRTVVNNFEFCKINFIYVVIFTVSHKTHNKEEDMIEVKNIYLLQSQVDFND